MLQTINLSPKLDQLASQKWTALTIDLNFCKKLANKAHKRLKLDQFKLAGLAGPQKVLTQIRNDRILWLDEELLEFSIEEKELFNFLEQLQKELKAYFRLSLTHFECHYAFYEKDHFYQRHVDTTQIENKRIYSFVLYLNENWQASDQGHLIAYQNEQKLLMFPPQIGQLILFRSDLEHEVEITNRDRLSVAGWFRQ